VSVAILGVAQAARIDGEQLEELVHRVSAAALRDAGVSRDDLDSVTLAASDERDGRSISSMLTAVAAGGLGKEVTKVTDGSLHALALSAAKVLAGASELCLVASWDIASEADLHAVATSALEPFLERPLGLIDPIATAMHAAAAGVEPAELDARARSKGREPDDGFVAFPLRTSHLASERDGAAAVVLASSSRLGDRTPAGWLDGIGWATDAYALDRAPGAALRVAAAEALRRANAGRDDLDSFELDDRDAFSEMVAAEAIGAEPVRRADDGFAGLPTVCSGLWRIAQLCHAPSDPGRSLVHQAVGRAGQGHVVAIVRREARA
jgi:hypothetical protein